MKGFFDKYGSGSKEPYQALEIIIEKLFNIKEKIERGDGNIVTELSQASTMLDDFAHEAKTTDFKPREYHNIQGHPQHMHPQHGPHNNYDTIRMNDRMGYRQTGDHYYPMYPFYPFFNEDTQGIPRRNPRPDYYPDQPEAYRRNHNRFNER